MVIQQDTEALRLRQREEAAVQVLLRLNAAYKASRLYSPRHDLTVQCLGGVLPMVDAYLADHGPFAVNVANGSFSFDFSESTFEMEVLTTMIVAAYSRLIRRVTLTAGLTQGEVQSLLEVLITPRYAVRRLGGPTQILWQKGVAHIAVVELTQFTVEVPVIGKEILLSLAGQQPLLPESREEILRMLGSDPQDLAAYLQEAHGQVAEHGGEGAPGFAPSLADILRGLDRIIVDELPSDRPGLYGNLREALRLLPERLRQEIAGAIEGHPYRRVLAALLDGAAGPAGPLPAPTALVQEGAFREFQPLTAADQAWVEQLRRFDMAAARGAMLRFLAGSLPDLTGEQAARAFAAMDELLAEGAREGPPQALLHPLEILAALPRTHPGLADPVHDLLTRHLTPAFLSRLVEALPEMPEPAREGFLALLYDLREQVLPVLTGILGEEERMSHRNRLVGILAAVGRDQVRLLGSRLLDPRWYMVRNIVTVLGEIGGAEALPFLRAALTHDDPRVRREAVRALVMQGSQAALSALARAIAEGDEETKMSVVRWVGASDWREAVPLLAEVLAQKPWHKEIRLKEEAIRVLAGMKAREARPGLERLARIRSLVHRQAAEQLRTAAREALKAL